MLRLDDTHAAGVDRQVQVFYLSGVNRNIAFRLTQNIEDGCFVLQFKHNVSFET